MSQAPVSGSGVVVVGVVSVGLGVVVMVVPVVVVSVVPVVAVVEVVTTVVCAWAGTTTVRRIGFIQDFGSRTVDATALAAAAALRTFLRPPSFRCLSSDFAMGLPPTR